MYPFRATPCTFLSFLSLLTSSVLVESARREHATKGLRVTLIEPGVVASEFQQASGYDERYMSGVVARIAPVLQPEDVARTVVFTAMQPAHVHASNVVLRNTRGEYP